MLVGSKIIIFFSMLISLVAYLFINIKLIGEGSPALGLIGFSVLCGSFLVFMEIILKKEIYLKKSFLVLVLFLSYFMTNVVINRPHDLKAMLIATSGGIFLFYILGSLVSINFIYIKEQVLSSKKYFKLFNFLYIIFSIIFSILFVDTFMTHYSNIREDLFLIEELDGAYQRPGSFLTISFFLYSFMTIFYMTANKYFRQNRFKSFIIFIWFCTYIVLLVFGIFLSQLFGSNNTFVNLSGLLFAMIVFYIFINYSKSFDIMSNIKLTIKKILLSIVTKKILISIVTALLFLAIVTIYLLNRLEVDLDKFRIFGFGSGDLSSVSSRMELFNNFLIHFNYNPVFGNMAIDNLTTGEGTYIHSFIFSMLSHLGIVGFILFFLYLIIAIKEKLNYSRNIYVENTITLYSLIVFIGIFAIASFGTFLTYVPIWFLLGLIFTPIVFKTKGK